MVASAVWMSSKRGLHLSFRARNAARSQELDAAEPNADRAASRRPHPHLSIVTQDLCYLDAAMRHREGCSVSASACYTDTHAGGLHEIDSRKCQGSRRNTRSAAHAQRIPDG